MLSIESVKVIRFSLLGTLNPNERDGHVRPGAWFCFHKGFWICCIHAYKGMSQQRRIVRCKLTREWKACTHSSRKEKNKVWGKKLHKVCFPFATTSADVTLLGFLNTHTKMRYVFYLPLPLHFKSHVSQASETKNSMLVPHLTNHIVVFSDINNNTLDKCDQNSSLPINSPYLFWKGFLEF